MYNIKLFQNDIGIILNADEIEDISGGLSDCWGQEILAGAITGAVAGGGVFSAVGAAIGAGIGLAIHLTHSD